MEQSLTEVSRKQFERKMAVAARAISRCLPLSSLVQMRVELGRELQARLTALARRLSGRQRIFDAWVACAVYVH